MLTLSHHYIILFILFPMNKKIISQIKINRVYPQVLS